MLTALLASRLLEQNNRSLGCRFHSDFSHEQVDDRKEGAESDQDANILHNNECNLQTYRNLYSLATNDHTKSQSSLANSVHLRQRGLQEETPPLCTLGFLKAHARIRVLEGWA